MCASLGFSLGHLSLLIFQPSGMGNNSANAVEIEARALFLLPVFVEIRLGDTLCRAELIDRVGRLEWISFGIAHSFAPGFQNTCER